MYAARFFPEFSRVRSHETRSALARVRALVAVALESMTPSPGERSWQAERARRFCAIVSRCDLGDEPHAAVAKDLGISLRQFYRDRGEACARLADEIEAQLAGEHDISVAPSQDLGTVQLWLADSLESAGQFGAAYSVLENALSGLREPLDRAATYRRLIVVLCDAGRIADASHMLTRAKGEMIRMQSGGNALLDAEMLACEAAVLWHTGGSAPATAAATRAIELLRPLASAGLPRARALTIDLQMTLAMAKREAGEFEESAKLLDHARAYLDARSPAAIRATLLLSSGYTHLMMPWGVRRASEENAEALEFAQQNGLVRHAAAAFGNLAVIHRMRGEHDLAADYGRKALAFEPIKSRDDFANLAMEVAQIEAEAGHKDRAMALLARVRPYASANTSLTARFNVVAAHTLLVSGEFDKALKLADSARQALERFGLRRRIGLAFCVQAEAHAALGDRHVASSMIGDAIDALQREGSVFSLARAYKVSGQITGNLKHRAYAAELFAMMRA